MNAQLLFVFVFLLASLLTPSNPRDNDVKEKKKSSENMAEENGAETTLESKKAAEKGGRRAVKGETGEEEKKKEETKEEKKKEGKKEEKEKDKEEEKKEKKKTEKKKEEKLAVKIVENPATPHGAGFSSWSKPKELILKVKPANFSGPPPFKSLTGKCFSIVANNYKYELCPFHNITQREQSSRWNAYAGVLGVWKDWVIDNNTFIGWHMPNGDSCGGKLRQMKVVLVCGKKHTAGKVSEPKTCEYEMEFQTPLACSRRNMAVYPWLNSELQQQWDSIEQEKFNGDLTNQGYQKYMKQIWKSAGFVAETLASKSEHARDKDKKLGEKGATGFGDVAACEKAYTELQDEVTRLKQQLAIFLPENVTAAMNGSSRANSSLSNSTSPVTSTSTNQTANNSVEIHRNGTKLGAMAMTANRSEGNQSHMTPSWLKVEQKGLGVEEKVPVKTNGSEQIEKGVSDRRVEERAVDGREVGKQAADDGRKSDKTRKDRHVGGGKKMVYSQGEQGEH